MKYLILMFLAILLAVLLTSLVFSYLVVEYVMDGNVYTSELVYDDIKFSLVCVIPQIVSISIITLILYKKGIIKFK